MRKEKEGDIFFELEQAEKVTSSEEEAEGNVLTVGMGPFFTIMCCK